MKAPMMMADNFNTATLLPDAAIRPSRLAEPLSCVPIEEKVSVCLVVKRAVSWLCLFAFTQSAGGGGKRRGAYGVVNHFLVSCAVVDIDGYAAEGGDLGGELL